VGYTDEPDVRFGPLSLAALPGETRPEYHAWQHAHVMNHQRGGIASRLPTQPPAGARVELHVTAGTLASLRGGPEINMA
jgi:hypothetical protein